MLLKVEHDIISSFKCSPDSFPAGIASRPRTRSHWVIHWRQAWRRCTDRMRPMGY